MITYDIVPTLWLSFMLIAKQMSHLVQWKKLSLPPTLKEKQCKDMSEQRRSRGTWGLSDVGGLGPLVSLSN